MARYLVFVNLIFFFALLSKNIFFLTTSVCVFETENISIAEPKDTVLNSQLQLLFDEYTALYKSKDSLSSETKTDSLELARVKGIISKYKKEISNLISKCDNSEKLHDIDSVKKYDSLKYESEIFHYNRSVDIRYTKIDSLNLILTNLLKNIARNNKLISSSKIEIDKLQKKIQPHILKLENGQKFKIREVEFLFFLADLDNHVIRTHLYHVKSKKNLFQLEKVIATLRDQDIEPLMVTNAGMFTPSFEPEGLYIEDNYPISFPLDTGAQISDANFYLKPNGVFYIDSTNTPNISTTEAFLKNNRKLSSLKLATQSGPMLVSNGKIHPSFTYGSSNGKIRSGVGILNSKKVLFAITLNDCNFYNFATFFKDLANCKNALFLDGAISKMYVKGLNETNIHGSFGPMISVSKK